MKANPSGAAAWRTGLLILGLAGPALWAQSDEFSHVPEPLRDLGKSRKIRVVYFVPQDREPTAHYAEKISVLMTFVADLYREGVRAHGFATPGPDFEFRDGRLRVELLRGTNRAGFYADEKVNSGRQWPLIGAEVSKALGSRRTNLYVVFAETYGDGPAKVEWPGGIAMGARFSADGGLGIFSAWVLRDEFCATNVFEQLRLLADSTPIEGRVALGHGGKNSPRFEFIEDGFGAVAHELGHAFGLPHDLRDDRRYIMGNGFRRLRVNYLKRYADRPRVGFAVEDARLLICSRFLSGGFDAGDKDAPAITVRLPEKLSAGSTNVAFTVECSDNEQLGAALYYLPSQNSTAGGTALEGKTVSRQENLKTPALKAGTFELTVEAVDRNGNQASAKARARVE